MNELLEKYWEGATTLLEEQRLKQYFASGSIDPAHEVYRPIFESFAETQENALPFDAFASLPTGWQEMDKKPSRLTRLNTTQWKSLAVAASFGVLLALGAAYQNYSTPRQDLGTYETPEEAYQATVSALQLMGTKINVNKQNLEPLHRLEAKTNHVFNQNNTQTATDSIKK